MRSKRVEFRMPWPLVEKSIKRCEEEHHRNFGRYLIALIMRDVIYPQRHLLTHAVANADPEEQDELLDLFLSITPETFRQVMVEVARAAAAKKQ